MSLSPLLRICLLSFCLCLTCHSVATDDYLSRRYYHRKVVLDEDKHDEEFFSFVTRPDLDAPRWNIEIHDEQAISPGYWFVAPYEEVSQRNASPPWNAPHIYDNNGELVWSGAPMFGGYSTFDFRVVNVQGREMLSVIQPHEGRAVIFDETYTIYKEIDMGPEKLVMDKTALNMHEFMTVENGTRALHMNRVPKKTSRESSAAIGFRGDCYATYDGFVELDTETWEPVFEWNSENHIGLDESYITQGRVEQRCMGRKPYEFFHMNSIDKFSDGDYLISGRRTNTVYKISHTDGSVVWRLGGRKSDFQMPFTFSGQHSAKIQGYNNTHTLISFLDNAYGPGVPQITNPESRGLLVSLDITAMTAEILTEFKHPYGTYARDRGNMQVLYPSKHAWLCWTSSALQSEHHSNGSLIMLAAFKAEVGTYRSWKLQWVGRPKDPPDVRAAAVVKGNLTYTIVHMSWNGATEVREWRVYHLDESYESDGKGRGGGGGGGGGVGGRLDMRRLAATTKKRGFETAVWTEGYASYVLVEAVGRDGEVLGRSYVFPTIPTHTELNSASFSDSEPTSSCLGRLVRSPLATFFGGILVCIFAVSVGCGIWLSTRRKESGAGWWRRQGKREVYERVSAVDHDQEAGQEYDEEKEEEESEGTDNQGQSASGRLLDNEG